MKECYLLLLHILRQCSLIISEHFAPLKARSTSVGSEIKLQYRRGHLYGGRYRHKVAGAENMDYSCVEAYSRCRTQHDALDTDTIQIQVYHIPQPIHCIQNKI